MEWLIKLKNGDYSLVVTFWIFNILYTAIETFCFLVILGSPFSIFPLWLRWVLGLSAVAYRLVMFSGLWKAADKYEGLRIWDVLSKVWIFIAILFYLMMLYIFIKTS